MKVTNTLKKCKIEINEGVVKFFHIIEIGVKILMKLIVKV